MNIRSSDTKNAVPVLYRQIVIQLPKNYQELASELERAGHLKIISESPKAGADPR